MHKQVTTTLNTMQTSQATYTSLVSEITVDVHHPETATDETIMELLLTAALDEADKWDSPLLGLRAGASPYNVRLRHTTELNDLDAFFH